MILGEFMVVWIWTWFPMPVAFCLSNPAWTGAAEGREGFPQGLPPRIPAFRFD